MVGRAGVPRRSRRRAQQVTKTRVAARRGSEALVLGALVLLEVTLTRRPAVLPERSVRVCAVWIKNFHLRRRVDFDTIVLGAHGAAADDARLSVRRARELARRGAEAVVRADRVRRRRRTLAIHVDVRESRIRRPVHIRCGRASRLASAAFAFAVRRAPFCRLNQVSHSFDPAWVFE